MRPYVRVAVLSPVLRGIWVDRIRHRREEQLPRRVGPILELTKSPNRASVPVAFHSPNQVFELDLAADGYNQKMEEIIMKLLRAVVYDPRGLRSVFNGSVTFVAGNLTSARSNFVTWCIPSWPYVAGLFSPQNWERHLREQHLLHEIEESPFTDDETPFWDLPMRNKVTPSIGEFSEDYRG